MRKSIVLCLFFSLGCSSSKDTPVTKTDPGSVASTPSTSSTSSTHKHDDSHTHEGNTVDAGPYHAKLMSHLSEKEGNELDIFFESIASTPKAVAFEHKTLNAKAKRKGDDKEYDLVFEPAPADERPKDEKPGTCSHYVAKAPFMKSTDTLTVTLKIVIRERERTVVWTDFDVKKFGHHHD
ncbi:MAG: hypothetical protein U0798_01005 [Gemmataceae bacterium]